MNAMLLFAQTFGRPREPRSEAYRQGAWSAMQHAVGGGKAPACPYAAGTAESDAWYAGRDEGRQAARAEDPDSRA